MLRALAAATLAAVVVACTPPDAGTPLTLPSPTATDAAPSPEPSPSPDAASVDVTTVPDEFTIAYVEAVFDANMAIYEDLYNQVLAQPAASGASAPPEAVDELSRMSTGDARVQYLLDLDQAASDEASRPSVDASGSFHAPSLRVEQISYAGPTCLIVVGRLDFAPTGAVSDVLGFFSFVRGDGDPTAWRISKSLPNQNGGQPNTDEYAFAATLADFGDLLEHDCTEADDAR